MFSALSLYWPLILLGNQLGGWSWADQTPLFHPSVCEVVPTSPPLHEFRVMLTLKQSPAARQSRKRDDEKALQKNLLLENSFPVAAFETEWPFFTSKGLTHRASCSLTATSESFPLNETKRSLELLHDGGAMCCVITTC